MLRRAFGQAAKMSTYTTDKASPFTRAVISSMRKLYVQARPLQRERYADALFTCRYPEALADQSFDNTGCTSHNRLSFNVELIRWKVLLEAPFDPIRRQMNSVLLTIDLTKAVADEAIERKDCVVVSYRMLV